MPSKVLNPTVVLLFLFEEYVGWVDDEGVDGDGGRMTGVIVLGIGDFSGGGGVRSGELLKIIMFICLNYFLYRSNSLLMKNEERF